MSTNTKFNEITGWASHGKDQKLEPFTYKAASLRDEDVEIEISHCGICGSDIHTLDSGWGPTSYPAIVGHEIIGKITAKGSKVTGLEIGDRVGVGAQVDACLKDDCFACGVKQDAQCPEMVWTYNDVRRKNGEKTYGGYAQAVRVQGDYAFKLPESIPSEFAAPLLCAGATVFSPMLRYNFKKGDRVGVVGIGGLGHLAIKYASALGCEVTAFSRSNSKKDEAFKMGATHYVATQDEADIEKAKNTLNYLIVTTHIQPGQWEQFSGWMGLQGRIILLAIPETNLSLTPFVLLKKNLSISGSLIASIEELKQTLAFSAEHKIYPDIEIFPMSKVNEGLQHVRDGKVRYRVVLEN